MFDEAVRHGMTDLTIFRVPEGWQASTRWRSSTGWRVFIHRQIDQAVVLALASGIPVEEDDGSDLV